MSGGLKRCMDFIIALAAMITLAPITAIVAVGIWCTMGRPILFRQVRPGLHEEPFTLMKFRTMTLVGAAPEEESDPRVTRFGRFLRKFSFDEFPQLLNVLKGDLSLVGPRPLLLEYLPLYTAEQSRRHEVRPGLTGLAQIRGRSTLEHEKRFAYDVWYVDHRSLWLDVTILAKTVMYVLRKTGIDSDENPNTCWLGNSGADGLRNFRVGSDPLQMSRITHTAKWLICRIFIPAFDSIAWAGGLGLATYLRYDLSLPPGSVAGLPHAIAVAVVGQWTIGTVLQTYRGRYYFASIEQAANLAAVTITVGLGLFGYQFLSSVLLVPRSVPLTASCLTLVLACGGRLVVALLVQLVAKRQSDKTKRLIIFGAGEAGRQLVKSMLAEPRCEYLPVAMLDDDPGLRHRCVSGIRVLGNRTDLAAVATATGAELLVIAVPSADISVIGDLTAIATAAGMTVKQVPSVSELLQPCVGLSDLREVSATSLLGRPPVETDLGAIAGYLRGKRVLVTGAGGSIGAELCRQINRFKPAELMMLDRDESALHAVQLSISGTALMDSRDVILADIRDVQGIRCIFLDRRPEVVFHAAALKHLPMLEQYPAEAWKTNVLGTANVVDAALVSGVERFVNISTDKAANPISVLGRSKRIGERLVAGVADSATNQRYLSVRFGNVLGSRGSVLTTFVDQITGGRPVTVTHPDVTRFFMTIPEAVELVIQAATIGRPGEVLVLDMGAPVRIVDMVEKLGNISGRPLSIVYTGLRDGEKLHEELFGEGELDIRPVHPAIAHVSVPPLCLDDISSLDGVNDPISMMDALTHARVVGPADDPAASLVFTGSDVRHLLSSPRQKNYPPDDRPNLPTMAAGETA